MSRFALTCRRSRRARTSMRKSGLRAGGRSGAVLRRHDDPRLQIVQRADVQELLFRHRREFRRRWRMSSAAHAGQAGRPGPIGTAARRARAGALPARRASATRCAGPTTRTGTRRSHAVVMPSCGANRVPLTHCGRAGSEPAHHVRASVRAGERILRACIRRVRRRSRDNPL